MKEDTKYSCVPIYLKTLFQSHRCTFFISGLELAYAGMFFDHIFIINNCPVEFI